jgi:hypothetical protein
MKLNKTATMASVALGTAIAFVAYSAIAQTPAAAPAPAAKAAAPAPTSTASTIPRFVGNYRGEKVDAMTYVPSCPAFTMGLDAAAIQESNSRAFVEGESRKLSAVRDQWDAYEDCLTENARRDIDVVRTVLGETLSGAATAEADVFRGLNAAASGNIERIGKVAAAKAPKAPRGGTAPAAAPTAAPGSRPGFSAWTPPTGRFIGTLSGTAAQPVYKSGCPEAFGTLSPAMFASEATREGYTVLLDELKALPDRINQVRTCRQENGQQDYEAVQKVVTDGVNAVFVPRKSAFEREYAAVQFQLNEHRKPGGLLAPPEMNRGKAKAPPAARPKAKKRP